MNTASFWNRLPRPFFALAPMADVTDPAYRKIIAKYAKPDVMWTEFVSADGLYHTRETKRGFTKPPYQDGDPTSLGSSAGHGNPLMRDLQFDEGERPIVAQIFGSNLETIAYAARLCAELGFAGVDLNMGCPDGSIEKQGAGAAMMKNPAHAQAIIRAAQDAVANLPKSSYRTDLVFPISVKTRIGYSREQLEEWLPALLECNPAAITLHLRTRKEMSAVPAHWNLMPRAVELRNRLNPSVLLLGNGDLKDLEDARAKVAASGCDGAMLGRAIFGNPWLFNRAQTTVDSKQKLDALLELAQEFEKLRPAKSFAILKKHIKAFVQGYNGAAELRAELMKCDNAAELKRIASASA